MKRLYFILFFIIGTFASTSLEYHGNQTYWTTVDDQGKTFVALHILAEPVNIIFTKDKTFADIASEMKLYSPTGNGKCQDLTNTLDFTLLFDDENHIRGEIKLERFINNQKVKMYLYEKCDGDEKHNDYATGTIEDIRQDFEADGRDCFKTRDPFHPYVKEDTKNVVVLQRTPIGFRCQVFLILPEYMHVEDFPLPTFDTVKPLNTSFAGHDEKFWWKSANDSMLPEQVSIDSSKNVIINGLNVVVTTSEPTESAGLEWYWYLIIGILIVGILVGIIILVFCIRRRRQKAKKSKIPVESVGRRTITTKTAVSPEKVSKEMKPKVSDRKKKEKKKEKQAKKEATKGNDKPLKPPSAPKPPPLEIVPAKPLRNLKHRSMYGEDKRTKVVEPYDYHADENPEFQPAKTPAEFPRPDLRVHDNFWDCLAGILKTTMFCRVFADNFFHGNTNVYFMFRDLVAESVKYAPLRILSNRILEQYEDQPRKSIPPYMEKGGKKRIQTNWCYCLRVFVLSYDPLTVEIHCRGPWPHFMFEIFKCDKCGNLLEEVLKNEWKNSPVACDESWDQFVCRVKRTPINSHQFLCYYGGPGSAEPENQNDVHNVFVFRGEWEQDNLRDCVRGCSVVDDKSHFNECELETSLQKSPSLSK